VAAVEAVGLRALLLRVLGRDDRAVGVLCSSFLRVTAKPLR
jgi:hypothetical protein